MLAREVVESGPESNVSRWQCSGCDASWVSRENADNCCVPPACVVCGSASLGGHRMCSQCGDVGQALDEESQFKAARKLKYMDYEGEVLYWAGAGSKGLFFRNKTKIDQYCTERALTAPRWVWGCVPTERILQAETVLGLMGNLEDLRGMMDPAAEGALQAALDAWVSTQGLQGFRADFSTAVVIDRALYGQTEKTFYEIEGYEPIRDGLVVVDVEDAVHLETNAYS